MTAIATARKVDHGSEPSSARPRKKTLIVASIVILLLLAGFFTALRLAATRNQEAVGPGDASVAHSEAARATPIFVRFDPITVKLKDDEDGRERYLQVLLDIRVLNTAASEKAKAHMPELRNLALEIFMSQTAAALSTPAGIDQVARDLQANLNQILDDWKVGVQTDGRPIGNDGSVQEVLFESFIIQ